MAVVTLYKDVASDMDYWFPVPITTTLFYAINFASLFTLLIAILADDRKTPEGTRSTQRSCSKATSSARATRTRES